MEAQAGKPMERPTGVTILAVLYIIQGIAALFAPLILMVFLAKIIGEGFGVSDLSALTATTVGVVLLSCSAIFALICFLIALGLIKGKGWARIVALIFAIIGLIFVPVGTIISIIIIYYLTRPEVKAWFQ